MRRAAFEPAAIPRGGGEAIEDFGITTNMDRKESHPRHRTDRRILDDDLARSTAAEIHAGRYPDTASAMRAREVPSRLRGLIRRHLEAMRSAAMGEPGLRRWRADRLRVALDLLEAMDLQEERFADDRNVFLGSRLAGRAALGRIDPEDRLHLRHHGERGIRAIAAELEAIGVEPVRLGSSRSRFGTLETIEGEFEGAEFRIRRCPPNQVPLDAGDLHDGGDVPLVDAAGLALIIDRLEAAADDGPF